MVNDSGRAVLADFGFVNFSSDLSTRSLSAEGGTLRWMAPELLDPERYGFSEGPITKESDCYALGMVMYEVLSGFTPFGTSTHFTVMRYVLEGKRPERPEGDAGKLFTDNIWDIVERCWKDQPKDRASARDVLRCLGGNPDDGGEGGDLSDAAPCDPEYVSSN